MVQLHEKVRATRTDTELDRELEKLSGFLFAGHDGDISRHEKLLSKYEQLLVSRIESMAVRTQPNTAIKPVRATLWDHDLIRGNLLDGHVTTVVHHWVKARVTRQVRRNDICLASWEVVRC